MSTRSATSSKASVPKRPSAIKTQASIRSTTSKPSKTSKTPSVTIPSVSKTTAPPSRGPAVVDLPAFSLPFTAKKTQSELEKLKKKTVRRNAPPGEDLKCIKTILRNIRGQPITVQEFVGLIGPSTGDKGEVLRVVMNDDINSFRRLARKVYETITQDNSDVLLNQQLQLTEYYREKKNLLHFRMMKAIQEIHSMVPKFDFDHYAAEGEDYLLELFPVPEEARDLEPEEMEMMKRQAAYHRLQWLHSEGVRLNQENNALKKRLNLLKKVHLDEQQRQTDLAREAQEKKLVLQAEEASKQQTLERLNQSLEASIVNQETSILQDQTASELPETVKGKKLTGTKKKLRRPIRRKDWTGEAAQDLEQSALQESQRSEASRIRSPFHFSPIKTPPKTTGPPKEKSPFHFSPIKTPPQASVGPRERSPFHYSPPQYSQPRERDVGEPVVSVLPRRQAPTQPEQMIGRFAAQKPRDSWRGFF